ncbi:MAG: hypothetical protein IJS12_00040 [Lachnospiraceae bacterium]|nr:hypothetical protein [Lachnospiraceae bacterium]
MNNPNIEKSKDNKDRIKNSRALRNNIYACGLLFNICPSLVMEEGTHESLLKMDGRYAQMWKVQAGRYETGETG